MQSYKELTVWQKSMDFVGEVYRLSQKLPHHEQYALTDQLRRSAISIPSNIAEGYGRHAPKEYARFLSIARGSKNEAETQLLLCIRLGYLQQSDVCEAMRLCDEIGKMLNAIIQKLSSIA